MVLSQFNAGNDENNDTDKYRAKERYDYGKRLANLLSYSYSYTGKAMRALTMISVLSHCAGKRNDMASSVNVLTDYIPTELLITFISQDYPVIGSLYEEDISHLGRSYSIKDRERYRLERSTNSAFNKVFENKLAELLSLGDMEVVDRARLEELRDFYIDTLCRFFFNLRIINLPRVFHLISVVNEHKNEKGCISEDELNKVVPSECKALLGNEAILTKDSVDTEMTWYRVNGGIKNFAMLTERFNLFTGYKKVLLDKVIKSID
jgi:hypothetical protein